MKKMITTFLIAFTITGIVTCGSSKPTTGSAGSTIRENSSVIMDSAAQLTPPTTPDSTKQ